MANKITGLHHVTAISSDAQKNVDFYAGILGLRMIKKTVNFDAPDVYHLYYGNEYGSPGTIMTFFIYPGAARGRKGYGQLTVTSFSVPAGSLGYWIKRLDKFSIPCTKPVERFGSEEYIYFEDYDGLGIELIANTVDTREGFSHGQIPAEHTIKGFYGIALKEEDYNRTAELLTGQMDHKLVAEQGSRFRFSTDGKAGNIVDILSSANGMPGLVGNGTVHHVAFATPGDKVQLEVRDKLLESGLYVTPVINRQYFHSIYFREPGGVLFEVATNPPGFAIDENPEHLGQELKLPPWEEANRTKIEKGLVPISLNIEKFRD